MESILDKLKESVKKVRCPKFKKPFHFRTTRKVRAWRMDGAVIMEFVRFAGPNLTIRINEHEATCARDVLKDVLLVGRPMQYSERECYERKGKSKTADQVLETKARRG